MKTGFPIKSRSSHGVEKQDSQDVSILFSPTKPGLISSIFEVDNNGYILRGVGLEYPAEFVVEMEVAGSFGPLVIDGKRYILSAENTILPIDLPGRYRLRAASGAVSCVAIVEGLNRSRWT